MTDGGTAGFMPDGGTPEDDADGDCPDCGHADYFDATDILRSASWEAETTDALREHDRVCADCGEIYG